MIDMKEWMEKRTHLYRCFCVITACLGAEYSILVPSLWFYIHDVIKADHAKMFYGVIQALYFISSIFGSFIITRYVDKSRNARRTILSLLFIEGLGSIIYTIYYSVYFPLVARFIQGFGDVNMSLMIAELARIYPAEDCTIKIANLVLFFSASFVLAPALNIVFKYINFKVLGFHINYGNFPGVLMAFVFGIVFCISFVYITDVSKKYDLKAEADGSVPTAVFHGPEEKINTDELYTMEKSISEEISRKELKISDSDGDEANANAGSLLYSVDFVLLTALGMFMSFCIVTYMDSMPVIMNETFSLNSQDVALLFFVTGLLFIISLQFVMKLAKTISEHTLLLCGMIMFIVCIFCTFIVHTLSYQFYRIRVVIYISHVILLGQSWCLEQVFVRSMLAKLVPSEIQSFGEGVRRSFSSTGSITAAFAIPVLIPRMQILSVAVICVTAVFMIILLCRRHTLKEIRILKIKV